MQSLTMMPPPAVPTSKGIAAGLVSNNLRASSSGGVSLKRKSPSSPHHQHQQQQKQQPLHASLAQPAQPMMKVAGTVLVDDPTPVTYLKSLFDKTVSGRAFLKGTQRPAAASSSSSSTNSTSTGSTLFRKPTQECMDAYDLNVVKAVRDNDLAALKEMLRQGKSLNACNRFGESIMHMACRRGMLDIVTFLLDEADCAVDIRDDFGRTPLHDACWTTVPNFEVMDAVIQKVHPDMLLVQDVRGHTPFHYARKEHMGAWVSFLEKREQVLLRRLDVIQVVS